MQKFKNKYRIPSARKPDWDYRNAGAYFITICTHNRIHHFGNVKNGKMLLNGMGAMVQGFWYEIPKHFDHVQLGEFIAMPNHIHGIIILMDSGNDISQKTDFTPSDDMHSNRVQTRHSNNVQTRHCHVSTTHNDFYKKITPKSGSISTIIGSFKSVCTKYIRRDYSDSNFKWQERFHDHIIRDDNSFERISNYIINNPKKWMDDKFHNL